MNKGTKGLLKQELTYLQMNLTQLEDRALRLTDKFLPETNLLYSANRVYLSIQEASIELCELINNYKEK